MCQYGWDSKICFMSLNIPDVEIEATEKQTHLLMFKETSDTKNTLEISKKWMLGTNHSSRKAVITTQRKSSNTLKSLFLI